MIERISTDLPVPDPPTTPRISPRRTVRSRPSCTAKSPKRLTSPSITIGASLSYWGVFACITQPHPTSVKNTAKKASSTITAKIADTTAIVVRRPTSSESPRTCMP